MRFFFEKKQERKLLDECESYLVELDFHRIYMTLFQQAENEKTVYIYKVILNRCVSLKKNYMNILGEWLCWFPHTTNILDVETRCFKEVEVHFKGQYFVTFEIIIIDRLETVFTGSIIFRQRLILSDSLSIPKTIEILINRNAWQTKQQNSTILTMKRENTYVLLSKFI